MNVDKSILDLSDVESFHFLFKCLWSSSSDVRCNCSIPDVLVFHEGRPFRWLFTSDTSSSTGQLRGGKDHGISGGGGLVMKKKSDKMVSAQAIVSAFKERSSAIRGSKSSYKRSKIATLWFVSIEKTVTSCLLDSSELLILLNSLHDDPLPEILAIQVYFGGVPLKGSGVFEHKVTVQQSGSLEKSAAKVHETFELTPVHDRLVTSIFSSEADVKRLTVYERQHGLLTSFSQKFISHIEFVAGCKVHNAVFQMAFNTACQPILVAARNILLQGVNFSSKASFVYSSGTGPRFPVADNIMGIIPNAQFEKTFVGTENTTAVRQRDKVQNIISHSMTQIMEYLDVLMPNDTDYNEDDGTINEGSETFKTNSKTSTSNGRWDHLIGPLKTSQRIAEISSDHIDVTQNLNVALLGGDEDDPFSKPKMKERIRHSNSVTDNVNNIANNNGREGLGANDSFIGNHLLAEDDNNILATSNIHSADAGLGLGLVDSGYPKAFQENKGIIEFKPHDDKHSSIAKQTLNSALAYSSALNNNIHHMSNSYDRSPIHSPTKKSEPHYLNATLSQMIKGNMYMDQIMPPPDDQYDQFDRKSKPRPAYEREILARRKQNKGTDHSFHLTNTINDPFRFKEREVWKTDQPFMTRNVCFGDYCNLGCGIDHRAATAAAHREDVEERGRSDVSDDAIAPSENNNPASVINSSESCKSSIEVKNIHSRKQLNEASWNPYGTARLDATLRASMNFDSSYNFNSESNNNNGNSSSSNKSRECKYLKNYKSIILARAEKDFVRKSIENEIYISGHYESDDKGALSFDRWRDAADAGETDLIIDSFVKQQLREVVSHCYKRSLSTMLHDASRPPHSNWDSINAAYRSLVYTDKLRRTYVSRFYVSAPLCEICYKIYTSMDDNRKRFVEHNSETNDLFKTATTATTATNATTTTSATASAHNNGIGSQRRAATFKDFDPTSGIPDRTGEKLLFGQTRGFVNEIERKNGLLYDPLRKSMSAQRANELNLTSEVSTTKLALKNFNVNDALYSSNKKTANLHLANLFGNKDRYNEHLFKDIGRDGSILTGSVGGSPREDSTLGPADEPQQPTGLMMMFRDKRNPRLGAMARSNLTKKKEKPILDDIFDEKSINSFDLNETEEKKINFNLIESAFTAQQAIHKLNMDRLLKSTLVSKTGNYLSSPPSSSMTPAEHEVSE